MARLFGSVVALACLGSILAQLNPTIPLVSSCPGGTVIMVLHEEKSGAGTISNTTVATSLVDCSSSCAASDSCVGFDYNAQATCTHFSAVNTAAINGSDGVNFFQKSCVTSDRVCSSPFIFDMRPQKILVGFAREVVPADTVQQCFEACLTSFDTFGFECESVMYYPKDAECILNTEDRLDRPDLFVQEQEDEVIYFDNNCAGSQCYAPFVTQYIKVKGKQLANELDVPLTTDFESCADLCTTRISATGALNCKSFMYNPSTQRCVLSDERSKPLGRADLAEGAGFDYYEKKCFASPRTCRNIASFDRVPQMILVGFAAFVMENVPSVTMCLDQCTNPPPETGDGFECKSVMYYYNEQECILNAETRASKPDLFIPEGDDFQVDYFDITCQLKAETCPNGRTPSAIRTINASLALGDNSTHVIQTFPASVAECRERCYKNSPEKCRSFNYDNAAASCTLLYLDTTQTLHPTDASNVDHYNLHCLGGKCKAGADTNSFNRYLNSHQTGISIPKQTFSSIALDDCLQKCIAHPSCRGVNFHRRNGGCSLYEALEGAGEAHDDIDFYENACNGENPILVDKKVGKPTTGPAVHGVEQVTENPFSVGAGVPVPGGVGVFTVCGLDGMQLQVNNGAPFTGAVFVKNKYDTCRVEVKDQATAQLSLGFPKGLNSNQASAGAAPAAAPPAAPASAGAPNPAAGGYRYKRQYDNTPAPPPPAQGGYESSAPPPAPAAYGGESAAAPAAPAAPAPQPEPAAPAPAAQPESYGAQAPAPAAGGYEQGAQPQAAPQPAAGAAPEAAPAAPAAAPAAAPEAAPAAPAAAPAAAPEAAPAAPAAAPQAASAAVPAVRDCGLEDLANNNYKATVVVQTNNLGIPGLVTSMDKIYEVTCDYSSMAGGKITAQANLNVNGPEPAVIQPRGKIELDSPVMMELMGAGDTPVLQAKLGDILELRWEMMALDEEMDFFVRDCYAEPGGIVQPAASEGAAGASGSYGDSGTAPAEKPKQKAAPSTDRLQLIEKGCPTPAVSVKLMPDPVVPVSNKLKTAKLQAFRFDSSRSVRVICALEICEGKCNPTACDMHGTPAESYGRKKRDSPDNVVTDNDQNFGPANIETSRYLVRRRSQSMTSLVVLDPMQEITTITQNQANFRSQERPVVPKLFEAERRPVEFVAAKGTMCMPKSTFVGVFAFLGVMALVQGIVVAFYLIRRLMTPKSAS
uniref:PAN domain-containing protein n=1 Tax=Plectus sambesii TaxID=2011161 RepID=A0A914XJN3_9BILA